MENKEKDKPKGEIVIYKDQEGPAVKVRLEGDNIWLTQNQIAELFGTQRPAITKHLKNIFKTAELSEKSVSSILEHTAADGKTYQTQFYNLDAIISVGYRVNSKRATQFRVWATQKLRDYILQGYVVNEKRLKERQDVKLKELEGAVKLLQSAVATKRLAGYEKELLNIISEYTNTWILLNRYDQDELDLEKVKKKITYKLEYVKIKQALAKFKERLMKQKEASAYFAQENDHKLAAVLGNIEQTFEGKTLYPSVDERAAHLLYFTVKDHPFVDGNKRIGALLFILYLVENHYLYNKRGEEKLSDNALVALTLLVAESRPEQKEVMVKLIVNLIKNK